MKYLCILINYFAFTGCLIWALYKHYSTTLKEEEEKDNKLNMADMGYPRIVQTIDKNIKQIT